MKLQVQVKTLDAETVTLELVASPTELVEAVKERILSAVPVAFPDQEVFFGSIAMSGSKRLSEYGVQDGSQLSITVRASEEAMAKQLQQLLPPRGQLSIEELSLMYSLKHGVTVGDALCGLGKGLTFRAFLETSGKHFSVQGNHVALATSAETTSSMQAQLLTFTVFVILKMPSYIAEATEVQLSMHSDATVDDVKKRLVAEACLPFTAGCLSLDGEVLQEASRLSSYGLSKSGELIFTAVGSEMDIVQQVVSLLQQQGPQSVVALDNAYCLRHGVSASEAVQLLGWGEKLKPFLERHPAVSVERGCLAPAKAPPCTPLSDGCNEACLELLVKLSPASLAEEISHALDELIDALLAHAFVSIRRVVRGGALGKGLASPGAAGVQLVAFLDGLPAVGQDVFLPSLAQSLAGVLTEHLQGHSEITSIRARGEAVLIHTTGPLDVVEVFLSADCNSYSEAVLALCTGNTKARRMSAAAFMEQQVHVIARQPPGTKATIRLMRWWREQRQWASPASRPSDELLEHLVVHTVHTRRPRDLDAAIGQVLEVLSHFNDLKLTWPATLRCYKDTDLLPSLLEEQPLVMSLVDPHANVADPSGFQPAEMMQYARSGKLQV